MAALVMTPCLTPDEPALARVRNACWEVYRGKRQSIIHSAKGLIHHKEDIVVFLESCSGQSVLVLLKSRAICLDKVGWLSLP